jgi:hypothetical protein
LGEIGQYVVDAFYRDYRFGDGLFLGRNLRGGFQLRNLKVGSQLSVVDVVSAYRFQ